MNVHIALLYAAFALLATAANIGAQHSSLLLYRGPHGMAASVLVGTAVGLVIKYLLDKRYIFRFQTRNAAHDGKLFVLYTSMGLATTAVFWATEWAFWVWFGTDLMRYLGACIGLAVGYLLKYRLDERYVFVSKEVNEYLDR